MQYEDNWGIVRPSNVMQMPPIFPPICNKKKEKESLFDEQGGQLCWLWGSDNRIVGSVPNQGFDSPQKLHGNARRIVTG